jgi:ribosomal protein L11
VAGVRAADSGIYICVATNEAGVVQQAFTLEVIVPPTAAIVRPASASKTAGSSQPDHRTAVGGNATLECLAKGMLITINRKKYYLN